jgi:hypothetical protein
MRSASCSTSRGSVAGGAGTAPEEAEGVELAEAEAEAVETETVVEGTLADTPGYFTRISAAVLELGFRAKTRGSTLILNTVDAGATGLGR